MRFTLYTLLGLGALGVVLWCVWRWYARRSAHPALDHLNRSHLNPAFGRLLTGMDGSSGKSVRAADTQPAGTLAPSTGYNTTPGGGVIRAI